jgi:lipid-A-disaccharide synthase
MSSCLIIAGEQSGEDHCMSFFKDLSALCPDTHFWGVGGESLKESGMEVVYHLNEFSSWGISEVVGKIPFYFKALKKIEAMAVERKCETAILIDFQDFNMRLAKKLTKRGVHVLYYVAPQAWAWKEYRASIMEKYVHTLFTILPFEKKWFQERGVKSIVGVPHPLLNSTKSDLLKLETKKNYPQEKSILLLPGSRNFEVKNLLPVFMESLKKLRETGKNFRVSIVVSPSVNKALIDPYCKHIDTVYAVDELNQAILESDLCLASSGTVTLSTGLLALPTIVCYKVSLLNEFIFNTFINYKGFISLTNIIHGRELFPELVQERATSFNITKVLKMWFNNDGEITKLRDTLLTTQKLLAGDEIDTAKYMSDVIKKGSGNI